MSAMLWEMRFAEGSSLTAAIATAESIGIRESKDTPL